MGRGEGWARTMELDGMGRGDRMGRGAGMGRGDGVGQGDVPCIRPEDDDAVEQRLHVDARAVSSVNPELAAVIWLPARIEVGEESEQAAVVSAAARGDAAGIVEVAEVPRPVAGVASEHWVGSGGDVAELGNWTACHRRHQLVCLLEHGAESLHLLQADAGVARLHDCRLAGSQDGGMGAGL